MPANNTGGPRGTLKDLKGDKYADLAAFDRLPPPLRARIANATFSIHCAHFSTYLGRTSEQALIEQIALAENVKREALYSSYSKPHPTNNATPN